MIPRKEIDELIALYSLEPDLRDIYVEGEYDKNLFEWFLMDKSISGIQIHPIDTINVSNDIVFRHNLNCGSNRSKVIALSMEFASEHDSINARILCIADKDFEDYLPSVNKNSFLKFTDYTSIDMYLLKKRVIQKMITLVLGELPISLQQLMSDVTSILEEVFIIRLANVELMWNMTWVEFIKPKYIKIKGNITFDSNQFTKAYLMNSGRLKDREIFEKKVLEIKKKLKADPRQKIRGHDLMELLHYIANKLINNRDFGNVETFQGAFTGCLESQDISKEPLFQLISEL